MHEQVIVKVNAPVDRVVAPLVEALNASSGVFTLNSCEADGIGRAYVDFTYGNSSADLVGFVENLAHHLAALKLCCGYSVGLEWFGDNPQPRGRLAVGKDHITDVAAVVREAISCDRTSPSAGDTRHIEPHR